MSYSKNYLYKLISKSLNNFYHESSVEAKIFDLIQRSKILFGKSLYSQYFKTLSSAKELAQKHERYGYLIQILEMENQFIKKEEISDRVIDEAFSKITETIELIRNNFAYSKLLSKTYEISREYGKIRNTENVEEITAMLNEKIMINENHAGGERAKEKFYHIKSLLAGLVNDHGEKLKFLLKRYQIIISAKDVFKDGLFNYELDILGDIIIACIDLDKTEEAEYYLNLIESQRDGSFTTLVSSDFLLYYARLLICIKNNETNKFPNIINQLEKVLIIYKDKMDISYELEIHFNIIKAHIISNNLNNALIKMNYFLNHPLLNVRADLECFARILNLIIHFELNNYSLLEHLIISVYRYLFRKKKKYKVETLILNFLRKLSDLNDNRELSENLKILKINMIELKQDTFEKNAFEYFDFISWIDDKLARIKN